MFDCDNTNPGVVFYDGEITNEEFLDPFKYFQYFFTVINGKTEDKVKGFFTVKFYVIEISRLRTLPFIITAFWKNYHVVLIGDIILTATDIFCFTFKLHNNSPTGTVISFAF